MRNIAVVLAGGTGSRMGSTVPKQFMEVWGRAVIEYSIDTMNAHKAIDEVAVVVHKDWREEMERIAARNGWEKLTRIIEGGSERYMSTLNAVMAYIDEPDDTNLLLHDAARPLVSADIVSRVVAALERSEAVGVAMPSTDTVWEVHPDVGCQMSEVRCGVPHFVARIPERRLMWRAQTPQGFRLPLLRDAYQRALQDTLFAATDDCGVVRRYMPGVKIAVVEGEERNMKVTTPQDLEIINRIFNDECKKSFGSDGCEVGAV